jgi:sec-independent protein translocase protein TatC
VAEEIQDDLDEEESDEGKMSLLEHLIELRQRLIRSFVIIILLFFVCYYFAPAIFNFLAQPLADVMAESGGTQRLIYTALHEAFFTYIKVAFFAALFVSFPFLAMQFWSFLAPGLYKHEKMALIPFLVATPILFFMGGALVYYVVMPLAWAFFSSFQGVGGDGVLPIEMEAKVNEYFSLVLHLIFAFGICFELPVVTTLLARAGMVTSEGMKSKRKYAVVMAFVAAAILTPPDVISQVTLAIPTILLYEISIFAVRLIEKQREARQREEDSEGQGDDDKDDGPPETA